MTQSNTNQEWRKLQARIENMFANYSQNDLLEIENKSQNTVHLLEMPEEYRQKMPGGLAE
jgi:hypothetical protein